MVSTSEILLVDSNRNISEQLMTNDILLLDNFNISEFIYIKYKTGFMKYLNPNIFCNYNLIYSLDQVSGTYMY